MPNYTVYCTWQMGVFLEVEADSLKEAIQKVQDDTGLPEGAEYRDNTFEIEGYITAECNDADPEDVYRYLDGGEDEPA